MGHIIKTILREKTRIDTDYCGAAAVNFLERIESTLVHYGLLSVPFCELAELALTV